MAYNLRNINVVDLRPSTGVGVSLPFSSPTAFTTVYTSREQLKYNIINFLLTDKGERIFNPTFGAGLRSRLFEQITDDSNEALKIGIQTATESYFPSVSIIYIDIVQDPDRSLITVQFSYRIKTSNETDNILLNIQNG
jgi:phage baseplate assembly protein W